MPQIRISFTQVEESLHFFHAHLNVFGKHKLFLRSQREKSVPNSYLPTVYTRALSCTPVLASEAAARMFTRHLQTDASVHLL